MIFEVIVIAITIYFITCKVVDYLEWKHLHSKDYRV